MQRIGDSTDGKVVALIDDKIAGDCTHTSFYVGGGGACEVGIVLGSVCKDEYGK